MVTAIAVAQSLLLSFKKNSVISAGWIHTFFGFVVRMATDSK
jgi:hypothetical protein